MVYRHGNVARSGSAMRYSRGENHVRIWLKLWQIDFWNFKSNLRLDDSPRMLWWVLLACVSWLPFLKHLKNVFYFFTFFPLFPLDLHRYLTVKGCLFFLERIRGICTNSADWARTMRSRHMTTCESALERFNAQVFAQKKIRVFCNFFLRYFPYAFG